jgi:hypothetical protein
MAIGHLAPYSAVVNNGLGTERLPAVGPAWASIQNRKLTKVIREGGNILVAE